MKNILIVDDVKGWRDFNTNVMHELFGEDINIDTAESAAQAYDYLLQQRPYDIILTDLQMEDDFRPQYAGEWFVEQIHNLTAYNKTRIIISSGCYNIKQIAESLNAEYMPKRIACSDINKYKDFLNGRLPYKMH